MYPSTMKTLYSLIALQLLLLSAHSLSINGVATRCGRTHVLTAPSVVTISSSVSHPAPQGPFRKVTDNSDRPWRTNRRQWFLGLFSYRRIQLPFKARRFLRSLLFALSIWFTGLAYSGSVREVHAALPVSLKFTGVEVVAQSPSFGGTSDPSDTMKMALQKRQDYLNRQEQQRQQQLRRRRLDMTVRTVVAAAGIAALPAGAKIALTRKNPNKSNNKINKVATKTDGDRTKDDTGEPESIESPQVETVEQVGLSQASEQVQELEASQDDDDASNGGESEFLFLTLVGLSAAATYSMYLT